MERTSPIRAGTNLLDFRDTNPGSLVMCDPVDLPDLVPLILTGRKRGSPEASSDTSGLQDFFRVPRWLR